MTRKEYIKEYRETHKVESKLYAEKYRRSHKKQTKNYRIINREKIKAQRKEYRAINAKALKIIQHEKYLKHRNEIILKAIEYGKSNKEIISKHKKDFYLKNKEIILKKREKYYKINKVKILHRHVKYIRNRRRNDINFKLRNNLSRRIQRVIKNNVKSSNTIKLVGCTIKLLKLHIENLFVNGMSWDNYGRGWNGRGMKEWHIDHIRPCASFDLSKSEEQLKCFHYTNLQPMWARENLIKHNKII